MRGRSPAAIFSKFSGRYDMNETDMDSVYQYSQVAGKTILNVYLSLKYKLFSTANQGYQNKFTDCRKTTDSGLKSWI